MAQFDLNWTTIRARLREAVLVLPHFLKNPVQGMRQLPTWEWPEILILQGLFAAACAILTSVVGHNYLGVLVGLVVGPITQYLLIAISAGFFFYTFMFYFHRQIGFREIYLTLVFAAIPALILNIVSPIVPPVILVGAATSLFLAWVGFVETFQLDRLKLRNLLLAFLVIYAVVWTLQTLSSYNRRDRIREKATPESLDILEKELNIEN